MVVTISYLRGARPVKARHARPLFSSSEAQRPNTLRGGQADGHVLLLLRQACGQWCLRPSASLTASCALGSSRLPVVFYGFGWEGRQGSAVRRIDLKPKYILCIYQRRKRPQTFRYSANQACTTCQNDCVNLLTIILTVS